METVKQADILLKQRCFLHYSVSLVHFLFSKLVLLVMYCIVIQTNGVIFCYISSILGNSLRTGLFGSNNHSTYTDVLLLPLVVLVKTLALIINALPLISMNYSTHCILSFFMIGWLCAVLSFALD